jgi:hypothetical protein
VVAAATIDASGTTPRSSRLRGDSYRPPRKGRRHEAPAQALPRGSPDRRRAEKWAPALEKECRLLRVGRGVDGAQLSTSSQTR